jgi:hypothetical protein
MRRKKVETEARSMLIETNIALWQVVNCGSNEGIPDLNSKEKLIDSKRRAIGKCQHRKKKKKPVTHDLQARTRSTYILRLFFWIAIMFCLQPSQCDVTTSSFQASRFRLTNGARCGAPRFSHAAKRNRENAPHTSIRMKLR